MNVGKHTHVDWEQIWAIHAPQFKNNKAHITLPNGKEILLKPGPGFGDFSHPTTQLMIELMENFVNNQTVLDIGCGSGILSIAASKYGAPSVYGCDICKGAVLHAQENVTLNTGVKNVYIYPHSSVKMHVPSTTSIILMNMISSEQKQAWSFYARPFQYLISSGVISSEKKSYLEITSSWGWKILREKEKDGWLGFVFRLKNI